MKKLLIILSLFASPALALAADMPFSDFKGFVYYLADLVKLALPVVVSLAVLVFAWGLVKFISKSGDPKSHAEGKSLMIWGTIALFVMVSFMGLIAIGQNFFGITGGSALPYIQQSQ